ncbi:MAG: ABC transporter permease [Ancrocorticia sp.]|uniref:ABC transporter permease n=1 Tax=Ancrocorticia sp. TaxID=2593684 RepID=UPI003F8F6F6F
MIGQLTRLGLRTSWVSMVGIILLCAGLVFAVTASIDALYPTASERMLYASTVGQSPASVAFNGRGYGLTTLGGIAAFEIGFMGQLLIPILGLYTAIRHTRREEEAGRTELLTASRVPRLAPLWSGAGLLAITSLGTGVLTCGAMIAAGAPASGSVWYAAGITLLMTFFGSIGLVLGQLCQSTRTAYLTGLAVTTGAFLVRACVDGMDWQLTWLSPLGWFPEIRAFDGPQVWPLAAFALGSLGLFAVATTIVRHRDLGAGVLTPASGPEYGNRFLGTPIGIAWRLNRAPAFSWGVLSIVWAGAFGILTREMGRLIDENPMLLQALGLERGSDLVMTMAVVVVALASTSMCVQGTARLSAEESADRLGALLATRISRTRLWIAWWVVVAAAAIVILMLGALTLGVATWIATDDSGALARSLAVGLGYTAPVLFVAGFAGACRSIAPRLTPLAWALVAWITVVGFLDETLRLPEWSRNLSPLYLVGKLPMQDPDLTAIAALSVAAAALLALSVWTFARRDLRIH